MKVMNEFQVGFKNDWGKWWKYEGAVHIRESDDPL